MSIGRVSRFVLDNLDSFDRGEFRDLFRAIYGRWPEPDEYPADFVAHAASSGFSSSEARRVAKTMRELGWGI